MNRVVAAAAAGIAALLAADAFGQSSVGISIGINEPGVYGRINIGDVRPAIIVQQPVIIVQQPGYVQRPPVYIYAPDDHRRDWRRYCGRYNACGERVYFVQETWVRERYQQEHPNWDRGRGQERRDDDRHDNGKGNGKGKAKGHDRD